MTLTELRSKLRRLKIEKGTLDLVVIDYLQLIEPGGKKRSSENRVQELSDITRSLKAIAKELNVPGGKIHVQHLYPLVGIEFET